MTNSSDFGFNAPLYYFPVDPGTVPPRVVSAEPAAGDIFYLTNITFSFSEGVSGVHASDLLINGVAAASVPLQAIGLRARLPEVAPAEP